MEKVKKNLTSNVACIIVTYNRLELLKHCLIAVKSQSYKNFDIIIINNGSTDGTKEWLELIDGIQFVNQENVGGAGGFYTGMKVAYELGYDWVWLMDDDGEPDHLQLEKLLLASKTLNTLCVNALVCDISKNGLLSFGINNNGVPILTLKDAQLFDNIPSSINPFNGTLINREIINKIGFIKKEMYIWGDEMEYTMRIKYNGFSYYTITDAIHYHPTGKGVNKNVIPYVNFYRITLKPKDKSKIYFRNLGYIFNKYDKKKLKEFILFYSLYYIFRFKVCGLYNFLHSIKKGINNDFSPL